MALEKPFLVGGEWERALAMALVLQAFDFFNELAMLRRERERLQGDDSRRIHVHTDCYGGVWGVVGVNGYSFLDMLLIIRAITEVAAIMENGSNPFPSPTIIRFNMHVPL